MTLADMLFGGFITYFLTDVTNRRDKRPKFDILSTRDMNGVSDQTKKVIKIITTEDDIAPVGSFRYRVHRYPSDIDIMENVKACCDAETASRQIAGRLRQIAREVKASRDIFLGDFKAGVDERFAIDLSAGFSPREIRKKLISLNEEGLLSDDELTHLLSLLKRTMSLAEYEELKETLHNYYVIRWSLDELLKGEKMLAGNLKITLPEALQQDSIVKIDLWAPIDYGYREVTNYIFIILVDRDGEQTILNQSSIGDIDSDIEKYSGLEHKNSLKLAKRLWSKALFMNDTATMEKLYPLFGSDAAGLNQIVSEIEVLRSMLQKIEQFPFSTVMRQIAGFKRRINDHALEISLNTKPLYMAIDQILTVYQKDGHEIDRDFVDQNLEFVEESLKPSIETYSANYLDRMGINT